MGLKIAPRRPHAPRLMSRLPELDVAWGVGGSSSLPLAAACLSFHFRAWGMLVFTLMIAGQIISHTRVLSSYRLTNAGDDIRA